VKRPPSAWPLFLLVLVGVLSVGAMTYVYLRWRDAGEARKP